MRRQVVGNYDVLLPGDAPDPDEVAAFVKGALEEKYGPESLPQSRAIVGGFTTDDEAPRC